MAQFLLVLVVALTVGAVVFGVSVLVTGADQGLGAAEPDGRAVPLPGTRPLVEEDVQRVRFDVAVRGYRMAQVDQAMRRAAYDIGYKDELIGVLEAEVEALRDGRTADADVLRRAREAALLAASEAATDAVAGSTDVGPGPAAAPALDAVPAVVAGTGPAGAPESLPAVALLAERAEPVVADEIAGEDEAAVPPARDAPAEADVTGPRAGAEPAEVGPEAAPPGVPAAGVPGGPGADGRVPVPDGSTSDNPAASPPAAAGDRAAAGCTSGSTTEARPGGAAGDAAEFAAGDASGRTSGSGGAAGDAAEFAADDASGLTAGAGDAAEFAAGDASGRTARAGDAGDDAAGGRAGDAAGSPAARAAPDNGGRPADARVPDARVESARGGVEGGAAQGGAAQGGAAQGGAAQGGAAQGGAASAEETGAAAGGR